MTYRPQDLLRRFHLGQHKIFLTILESRSLSPTNPPYHNAYSASRGVNFASKIEYTRPYLYLVDINFPILLSHLFVGHIHSIHCGHCIPQVVCGECCGLHVETLLSELVQLSFIHPFLLQRSERSLLDCILKCRWDRFDQTWSTQITLPGPFRSLLICSLYLASSPSNFFTLTSIEPILASVYSIHE